MIKISDLPLGSDKIRRLVKLAEQYKRMGKIYIEPVSFNEEKQRLIVRVQQKEAVNGKILTKSELVERVREMFTGEIPDTWKLTVSAVDFDRKDIDSITVAWVKERMEALHLKPKNITTYTGIDKASLSVLFSGARELTKWHKVAFYYFFKYQELANIK